jgi:hypothetical protein
MSLPCPKEACLCDHVDCDNGWKIVEYEVVSRNGETSMKDGAVPCPVCLPERAAIFYKAQTSQDLQSQLQKRSGTPQGSNEPRTRIL